MLVITYTERTAGELRGRIRARLLELGRHDLARSLDGAWISTIHGFCLRLLKSHPFAAGLDPHFRVLDDSQARVIRGEAFEAALNEFCAEDDPERLRLLATYGAAGLRRMLTTVYETLRSAGRELELELGERPGLPERLAELAEAARCLAEDADAAEGARAAAAQALVLTQTPPPPERLLDLSGLRARTERAATYEEARKAVEQAALDELASRDRELLQELLRGFADAYAAAKDRESALDFEDLQLRDARPAPGRRADPRARAAPVRLDHGRRVPGHEPAPVRARRSAHRARRPRCSSSATSSSRSTASGTRTCAVFRERREAADTLLPLTLNYRSRPEVLAAVNHLFAAEFGDEFQPLAASGEFPDPVFGTPVELLVTDKAAYAGHGPPLAARRGAARRAARAASSSTAARRRAGEIVLLFAAGTDAEWYEEELRARGPADLPRDRPRLLRPAAGRRPALVPAAAPEPLRRRGARLGARVAVRRRLERRAAPDPPRGARSGRSSRASSARCRPISTSATRGCCARSGSATTGSSRRLRGSRSSGSASGSSPTTTTTSPCSRSGTAAAATRTCASSRGSRARTRSCAAPTSRASSASSASRRRSAPSSATRSPRRRAPTRSAC